MKFLKKMIGYLELVMEREASNSLSFWSSKSYSAFFDITAEGFWVMNPNKIAPLLPLHLIATSVGAEQAIYAELETYTQLSFWSKLWWELTKPMATYRQLYTLITIRNLKQSYQNMSDVSSKQTVSLKAILSNLGEYLTVSLSIFGSTPPSAQIFLKQLTYFKDMIELQYQTYLVQVLKSQAGRSSSELNFLSQEIRFWAEDFTETFVHFHKTNKSVLHDFMSEYDDLVKDVHKKRSLLEKVVDFKQKAPLERLNLPLKDKAAVDKVFETILYPNLNNEKQNSIMQETFSTLPHEMQAAIVQKQAKNMIFTYSLALEKKITKPNISSGQVQKCINQFLAYSNYALSSATHCLRHKKTCENLKAQTVVDIEILKHEAIEKLFQSLSSRNMLLDEIKRGEFTNPLFSHLEKPTKKLNSIEQKHFSSWLSQQRQETTAWFEAFIKLPNKTSHNGEWFLQFFGTAESPWKEEISNAFKILEARVNSLSKETFLKQVNEKTIELLSRFMEKQPVSINALQFAFEEMLACYQKCLHICTNTPGQLPRQIPKRMPSVPKSTLPLSTITLPKTDTETAWQHWLAEILQTPKIIPQALDSLAKELKQPTPIWQTHIFRYTFLIKLALHYVSAVKWQLIPDGPSLEKAIIETKKILKATYYSLALYYHPDKPTGKTEAIQKFNEYNELFLAEIEKALKNPHCPDWIANLSPHHSGSHSNAFRNERDIFIGQELSKIEKCMGEQKAMWAETFKEQEEILLMEEEAHQRGKEIIRRTEESLQMQKEILRIEKEWARTNKIEIEELKNQLNMIEAILDQKNVKINRDLPTNSIPKNQINSVNQGAKFFANQEPVKNKSYQDNSPSVSFK